MGHGLAIVMIEPKATDPETVTAAVDRANDFMASSCNFGSWSCTGESCPEGCMRFDAFHEGASHIRMKLPGDGTGYDDVIPWRETVFRDEKSLMPALLKCCSIVSPNGWNERCVTETRWAPPRQIDVDRTEAMIHTARYYLLMGLVACIVEVNY